MEEEEGGGGHSGITVIVKVCFIKTVVLADVILHCKSLIMTKRVRFTCRRFNRKPDHSSVKII